MLPRAPTVAISLEIQSRPPEIMIELAKRSVTGEIVHESSESTAAAISSKIQEMHIVCRSRLHENIESPKRDHDLCFSIVIGDSFVISSRCRCEIWDSPLTRRERRSQKSICAVATHIMSQPECCWRSSIAIAHATMVWGKKGILPLKKVKPVINFNKKSYLLYIFKGYKIYAILCIF